MNGLLTIHLKSQSWSVIFFLWDEEREKERERNRKRERERERDREEKRDKKQDKKKIKIINKNYQKKCVT